MNYLYLIPARGGSKGIPHKNLKNFNGKPLILYTIEIARQQTSDDKICVSTDDDEIIKVVENVNLFVPFKRPSELASDNCGTYQVILHALDFYEGKGENFDAVVLLQPTSPFRTLEHVQRCIKEFEKGTYDMVVSVCECKTNPYYNCFEADCEGKLHKLIKTSTNRRQDAKKVYEYNGAVYVMDTKKLHEMSHLQFTNIGFVEMDELHSLDLDTPLDWKFAEFVLQENY